MLVIALSRVNQGLRCTQGLLQDMSAEFLCVWLLHLLHDTSHPTGMLVAAVLLLCCCSLLDTDQADYTTS
jgi:hypothetical protein